MGSKAVQLTSGSHHEHILASLHDLRLQGQLSDVTVQVDYEGDVEEFHAHQVMLAASSGYFKKILLSPDASRDKLSLSNMHSEDFSAFLEFVYTGKVEVARDKIGSVQAAAEFLDCDDLLKVCGEAISAEMIQKPTKKSSKVVAPDAVLGAQKEEKANGKRHRRSLLVKRQLSPHRLVTEVTSKRFKAKKTVRDEKRRGRKLQVKPSGSKVQQRGVCTKIVPLNIKNQTIDKDGEEDGSRTEDKAEPEKEKAKEDECSLGDPASDGDDWECEDDAQSKDSEDPLFLPPREEEEEDEEEESKQTLKQSSKAQFQCNKCQRTFHYEKSYLKHIR